MNQTDNFIGRWIDTEGKTLHIYGADGSLKIDFYSHMPVQPLRRLNLDKDMAPTMDLPYYFDGPILNVELGIAGIGPFLSLEYSLKNDQELLIPEVSHGLYDDYEDDFGVPWIFPLSLYIKS